MILDALVPGWNAPQSTGSPIGQQPPVNLVSNALARLQSQAGSRGYTYAGRLGQPGDTPESIMGRTPMGELEGAGQTMSSLPLIAGAGIAGKQMMSKIPLESVSNFADQIFEKYPILSKLNVTAEGEMLETPLQFLSGVLKDVSRARGGPEGPSQVIQSFERVLKRSLNEEELKAIQSAITEFRKFTGWGKY